MPRARSLITGNAGGVIAPRPIFHKRLQVRIGGSQFPPTRRLPIRRHFESFRGASDSVTGKQRKNRVHWRWRRFKKERAYLKAVDIVVVVMKRRNIQIEMRHDQGPISRFIAEQLLGSEFGVAVDSQ